MGYYLYLIYLLKLKQLCSLGMEINSARNASAGRIDMSLCKFVIYRKCENYIDSKILDAYNDGKANCLLSETKHTCVYRSRNAAHVWAIHCKKIGY